jgi:hypothetical protein
MVNSKGDVTCTLYRVVSFYSIFNKCLGGTVDYWEIVYMSKQLVCQWLV